MWYAVFYKKTGQLYSTGSVLTEKIPNEFDFVELGDDYDFENEVTTDWDPVSKSFSPKPQPVFKTLDDRIAEAAQGLNLTKGQIDQLVANLKK